MSRSKLHWDFRCRCGSLLQKEDLEKAIGLTDELFPFTDDVKSSVTHSVSVHLVTEALHKGLVSLLLKQAFATRHHNKFFVGGIHECALLGNRAVCEVEKLVGTDYTFSWTRAALIRTYGTVNDRRRLLSSAREAAAVFPKVLSAVMDVATVMSSVTLAEFCCIACVAHSLMMWLAHFCCSLQATSKASGQAPEKINTEVLRPYGVTSVVSIPSKILVLKSFSSILPYTCPKPVWSKNSCYDPVNKGSRIDQKVGYRGPLATCNFGFQCVLRDNHMSLQ